MDGVSAAAGVIGIGTAFLNLAENINKLYDFWKSIQGAPDDLQSITHDLSHLHIILKESKLRGSDGIPASILDGCAKKVESLVALIDRLEPGFSSSKKRVRKWSAIKWVLQEGKIRKFKQSLEETKTTIALAQQIVAE
jgi:hypothetical protein